MTEGATTRLSRLLAMVPWLLQRQGVPLAEAAAHFGISEADLVKDLELLFVCGTPGHLPDDLHIPVGYLAERLAEIPRDRPIALVLGNERDALRVIGDGPGSVEWESAATVDLERSKLDTAPLPGATFGELAAPGRDPKSLERWKKSLLVSLRQDRALKLFQSATFKETSSPGETEVLATELVLGESTMGPAASRPGPRRR